MDWIEYVVKIRFASPFFMLGAALLVGVLYIFFARRRTGEVTHPYIGFFQSDLRRKKTRDPLLIAYRALPYALALGLIVTAGSPAHEERATHTAKKAPYAIDVDSSGSLTAYNVTGQPSLTLEDSMWNIVRLSLMQFVEEKKDTSEFFLMLYSDTPYAARYFAGGQEATVQIEEFLETLPEEVKKWQGTSSAFYLQGTRTAFAFEALMRYRASWPEALQESAFILITDLEDTALLRLAKSIDTLVEGDRKGRVYTIVVAGTNDDRNIVSFERSLQHRERVEIFRAHDKVSLDAAFHSISLKNPPQDIATDVLRSTSLRPHLLVALIVATLTFVGLGEFYVRRIP